MKERAVVSDRSVRLTRSHFVMEFHGDHWGALLKRCNQPTGRIGAGTVVPKSLNTVNFGYLKQEIREVCKCCRARFPLETATASPSLGEFSSQGEKRKQRVINLLPHFDPAQRHAPDWRSPWAIPPTPREPCHDRSG